jgi:CrcB protein
VSAPEWLAFLLAGAIGAPTRYLVDRAVAERTAGVFPWGTLAVNVSGSFVLGFITGLALYHALPDAPRIVIGTGFCGAYTTFSTFTFETARLAEGRQRAEAVRNVVASSLAATAAAAIGLALASL